MTGADDFPRLKWTRTWPDSVADFKADAPEGNVGRICDNTTLPLHVTTRWLWTVYSPSGGIGSLSKNGLAKTQEEAMRKVEDAWFAFSEGRP